MRRRTRYPFRLPVAALAGSLILSVAGCTDDPMPPDGIESTAPSSQQSPTSQPTTAATTDATAPTESAESTATETEQTTTAPSPTAPSPTVTSPATPVRRLRAALVPVADLPGFNDAFTWDRQRSRRGPGPGPLPGCSRATLISIGGVAAARSDYRSASDDSVYAIQVTARFPDEQTASRAESVLIAWHDRCQSSLRKQGKKRPRVGSIAVVATDVGTARQWLSTYGPVPGDPDATNFHAEGVVRAGLRISYLVIHNAGQDYNYESGDEPMAHALQKAAEYLSN